MLSSLSEVTTAPCSFEHQVAVNALILLHKHSIAMRIAQQCHCCRFQVEMSKGLSGSPSSTMPEASHQTRLHAEPSSASVGTSAYQQWPPASPATASAADHSFSAAWTAAGEQAFTATYKHQQADERASEQAGLDSVPDAGARDHLSSPKASTSSVQADTPKTLHLRSMAAQAERLQQVTNISPEE